MDVRSVNEVKGVGVEVVFDSFIKNEEYLELKCFIE